MKKITSYIGILTVIILLFSFNYDFTDNPVVVEDEIHTDHKGLLPRFTPFFSIHKKKISSTQSEWRLDFAILVNRGDKVYFNNLNGPDGISSSGNPIDVDRKWEIHILGRGEAVGTGLSDLHQWVEVSEGSVFRTPVVDATDSEYDLLTFSKKLKKYQFTRSSTDRGVDFSGDAEVEKMNFTVKMGKHDGQNPGNTHSGGVIHIPEG